MNQTNILVVASSLAALLTLAVVTVTQWVAPWIPLAVGGGWVLLWVAAWATLRGMDDVEVPTSPNEAMPALVAAAFVPLLGVLWMVSPVRAALAPLAMEKSPNAVESILSDPSSDVGLAACANAPNVEPTQWTPIADAVASRPTLAMQCAPSLTPELVDAVADRWATALRRPSINQATACDLTRKLARLRDGRPEVLTRDLMRCADKSESEAARTCCEQTFDEAVDPIALLDVSSPAPSVLASFIRVQFRPGQSLDEELAGRLLDATCEDPERQEVTAAYLPYAKDECNAESAGWMEAYGTEVWAEACSEELPYFRQVEERPLDEAVCRGLETAAVANAIREAKVGIGRGRATGRAKEGVAPGVNADVSRTARARGGGTSGAGIDMSKAGKRLPPEFVWSQRRELIIRGSEIDNERECRETLNASLQEGMDNFRKLKPRAETLEEAIGIDPCDPDEEMVDKLNKLVDEDYDFDEDGELTDDDIDAEGLMEVAPNRAAGQKMINELKKSTRD